jgi:hypothetical protein
MAIESNAVMLGCLTRKDAQKQGGQLPSGLIVAGAEPQPRRSTAPALIIEPEW